MTIGEVIEMLKTIIAKLIEIFGQYFNKEDAEGAEDGAEA